MNWKTVGQTAAVVLAIPITLAANDRPRHQNRPSLVVRTYSGYGAPGEDLAAARTHVEAIFGGAGIDVLWRDCWRKETEASVPAECLQPLRPGEVMLRLLQTLEPPNKHFVSLGSAIVKLHARPPYLATVFVDLAAMVARHANIDFRTLLGRAIAHEIGHLLLDSTHHADHGLMRAFWSHAELCKNDPADWVFRQDEAVTIRAAAANRRGLQTTD
jgi:hypothetical protein